MQDINYTNSVTNWLITIYRVPKKLLYRKPSKGKESTEPSTGKEPTEPSKGKEPTKGKQLY